MIREFKRQQTQQCQIVKAHLSHVHTRYAVTSAYTVMVTKSYSVALNNQTFEEITSQNKCIMETAAHSTLQKMTVEMMLERREGNNRFSQIYTHTHTHANILFSKLFYLITNLFKNKSAAWASR